MDQTKRRRKLSNKQEQKATKELGLKMSPASGATMFGGGDGRLAGKIRLECKFTEADFYILKLEDLLKLRKQAIKGGLEKPIFQIEFKGKFKSKYAVVEDYTLEEMSLETWRETDKKQMILSAEELYSSLAPKRIIFGKLHAIGEEFNRHVFVIYEWNDFLRREGFDDRN